MKVQINLFTGKTLGEYEAIRNANGNYEVSFKDGQLGIFNPETLRQQNAVKPQFACKMVIIPDIATYPVKMKDMNGHQKIAARQIKWAINDICGGLENTMSDWDEDSEEYKHAKSILEDHQALIDWVYDGIMNNTYGDGWTRCYPTDEVKFAGEGFLKYYISYKLEKEGY